MIKIVLCINKEEEEITNKHRGRTRSLEMMTRTNFRIKIIFFDENYLE